MQPVNQEEIIEVVEQTVHAHECEIYDWQLHGQKRKKLLRIYIYRAEGVTIDLCRKVSKALSRIFEEKDFFHGPYLLEVSSPGLERPLKEPRHFEQAVSEQAAVTLKNGVTLKGVLQHCDEDGFQIKLSEELVTVHFADVASAKTVFDFGKPKK